MMYDTKTNLKNEINKLKKMSFKDKMWYIKEYYLVYIILIVIVVAIFSSVFYNIIKKDPVFNTFFVNVIISEEEKQEINKGFEQYAELSKTKDFWNLDTSIKTLLNDKTSDPIATQQYLLKLTALLSSKKLDVMITQKQMLDYFLTMDAFMPLDDILPKDFIEKNGNILYTAKNIDNLENIYAINIRNSPVFKKLGITQDVYFAIAQNTPNLSLSLKFLEYIYK